MKRTTWRVFRLIWVTLGILFTLWMFYAYQSHGVEETVFESNSSIDVSKTKDAIIFTPTEKFRSVLIFYPGAMVETDAYAPLCRKIADKGYKVYLIQMPWRLATKGYKKPLEMKLFADVNKEYILAGHSQGAKMAAQFVYENPGLIDKLILMGTTHPRDINLSKMRIPVMKISGSDDGVASPADVERNKLKLPSTTKYVLIAGGNHSQFGYYGFQLGGKSAYISREKQQQIIFDSILEFIDLPGNL